METMPKTVRAARLVVLVADDSPFFRRMQQLILERAGYEVMLAEDGRAALAAYEEACARIDLIVTDLMMPEMNGVQLCAALRERGSSVPIVLVTGSGCSDYTSTPDVFGFNAAITKPFEPECLLELAGRLTADECEESGMGTEFAGAVA